MAYRDNFSRCNFSRCTFSRCSFSLLAGAASAILLLIALAAPCTNVRAAEGAWSKIAFDTVHVVALAADPVRPTTLYAVTGEGLQKSMDSGQTWTKLGANSLPQDIPASSVAVSPFDSRTIFVGYDGKGVFKSTDGGASWTDINRGMPNLFVRCIVPSQKDASLIYVGIQGGVAISTSGGEGWHLAYGFPRAANINDIVIAPNNPQYLFAATSMGIFKSGNGGVSWRDINEGLSSLSVLALHIDPQNPDVVLAGCYHPATPTDLYVGEASGGVYRSEDGGMTWKTTELENITIFSFATSPDYPGVVYAGAWGGAYRSVNGGVNWQDINAGLDNAFLHSSHMFEGRPPTVLAGTTYGLLSLTDMEVDDLVKANTGDDVSPGPVAAGAAALICLLGLVVFMRRKKKSASRTAW